MSQQLTRDQQPRLIRSAYSSKDSVQLTCAGKGRTKQSFKDECDINNIIKRFMKTGVLDFVAKHAPQYGDVTGLSFTMALDTVAKASDLFNDLPAKLRARFSNDPAQFFDFIQDPENREEAQRLGLLKPKDATPAPVATPVAPPPASAAPAAA